MGNYRPQDQPIAGYELIDLLGEGAFGAVWKAEGPGGVLVALKIISKLNGIHAIREWQSLQAVKNLKHSNLVNIYGVWLKDEKGHVLSTDEIQALIPAEVERPAATASAIVSQMKEAAAPKPSKTKRRTGAEPEPSNLRCETLQVGGTPSSVPPLDSPHAETGSPSGTDPGTDTGPGASAGSAGSAESAGSAGSRERWASLGDKVPPLELVTAMTLGDGTLLDRLKRCQASGQKGIPRQELMEHLRDAVKGLQFLNDNDVQHCDVKPENLLVVGGSVQVCDYGSALRAIYAAEARTNQGYTEQYAAPEQLGAKRIKVQKTTDLYALAITYYALRTGKFPWSDQAEEPIPLLKYDERFDFTALARQTRHRYERDVLRRALRRDPKQRQRSVTEFLTELERAIGQEALAEAAARRRRRQLAGWAATAVVLAVLVGAGFVNRDKIRALFRRVSDQDQLGVYLSKNEWEPAFALVGKSADLTKDDKATQATQDQLFTAIERLASVPQQADAAILEQAVKVPAKLRSFELQTLIVDTVVQPELAAGDFSGAARSAQSAANLPEDLQQKVNETIYTAWRPAAEAKERPSDAAAELALVATALPAYRVEIGPAIAEKLRAGLAAVDRMLDERSTTDWPQLAQECGLLSKTAGEAISYEPACQPLQFEARLRELAALVQAPHDRAAIRQQAEALAADLRSAGTQDDLLQARTALLVEVASDGNRLGKPATQALATLGPALQATPARLQAGKPWDVFLYRQLVQATFAAAAAGLADADEETLAALRQLPTEGGADLQIAQALLVHASRIGATDDDLERARKWLDESTSLKGESEAAAMRALKSWLALAGNQWFDPTAIAAAGDALHLWRQQPGQAPLAEASLVQVMTALVGRAEQAAGAADAAVFPEDVTQAMAAVDGLLVAGTPSDANLFARILSEASDNLHRLRLRTLALPLARERLATIPADLAAIEAARLKLDAGNATQRQLPPLAQPLDDLEIDAIAVEVHLLAAGTDRPPAVDAAWKRLQAATPPAAGAAAPKYDADYVSYVRDFGALRGLVEPPPADALQSQATSNSPWLASSFRRSTAASELLKRHVGQLPLPPDLAYVEASAPAFKAAAGGLSLVRAWDDSHPAAKGLLPVCKMYEQAQPDWLTVRTLAHEATDDPELLAALAPKERLHLWLALARACAAGSDVPAALTAYAALVGDPQILDVYGDEGPVAPDVCYREIIQPAMLLLPKEPAEPAQRASSAAIYGAQGALLEGDFSRDLAVEHFGYPKEPLAFVAATRSAFAAAAALEPDAQRRLRWITGQARAEDLLLSRVSEEVPAEQFQPLQKLAADIAASWPETFQANVLAGIVDHYQSRVVASQAERANLLEQAQQRLAVAEKALAGHPQAASPWCQGWLAQCREALSKIALEQSHMQPWGLEKQRLLNLAVERAGQAEAIDVKYRISPSSCLLCAGNAYEDLAVHLFCTENFELAEKKFQEAANMKLDLLTVRQSEACLGRVLERRANLDPAIENDAAKRDQYRDRAIALLERVSLNLREGSYRDPGLAQEAEYYLAETYLLLKKEPAKALALYRKIALEAPAGSHDRIDCLLLAATCRAQMPPKKGAPAAEAQKFRTDFLGDLEAVERELSDATSPGFREKLVALRFRTLATFDVRKPVADQHLAALQRQPGDESLVSQCEILLDLAKSKGKTEGLLATLAQADALAGKIGDPVEQLTTKFKLLIGKQSLLAAAAEAADLAQQENEAVKQANQALATVAEALAVAAKVDELQVTVCCSPTVTKRKFDTVKGTLLVRKAALDPVAVLSKYEVRHAADLAKAKQQVRQWWKEVELDKVPADKHGPTAEQLRQYRTQVVP